MLLLYSCCYNRLPVHIHRCGRMPPQERDNIANGSDRRVALRGGKKQEGTRRVKSTKSMVHSRKILAAMKPPFRVFCTFEVLGAPRVYFPIQNTTSKVLEQRRIPSPCRIGQTPKDSTAAPNAPPHAMYTGQGNNGGRGKLNTTETQTVRTTQGSTFWLNRLFSIPR